ncbi:hypothetical protein [Kitasatospora sp. NPDC094011]|uniref:hypothetical protein n=1 Tax=Kitasatospora sp. NPDC094011 TaxID=3364090 RepID=UPI00380BA4FF
MRVRLTDDVRLFWNYAIHDLHRGAEFIGDLAHHLASTGAPVEVIEHDPEPGPAPAQAPAPPAGANPQSEGLQPPGPDGLDIAGTIDTVLTWVGTDPARAQQALDAEAAKGDGARATLTTRLDAILQAVAP